MPDDRTTKARIRDAAISLIARSSTANVTARDVAGEAGVSAGSVIHHFGSMEGLRTACDAHVAALIRHTEGEALSSGAALDFAAMFSDPELAEVSGYLASVLTESSPIVDQLVDDLVANAVDYMAEGVEAGSITPSSVHRERTVLLAIWNLGALVLHRHLERLVGVDITSPQSYTDGDARDFGLAMTEVLAHGLLTPEYAAEIEAAMNTPPPAFPDAKGNEDD